MTSGGDVVRPQAVHHEKEDPSWVRLCGEGGGPRCQGGGKQESGAGGEPGHGHLFSVDPFH